jgi:hypothetical protein
VAKTFATQMFGLQVRIVRELNNAHIFLEEACTRLVKGRDRYANSSSKAEKRYYVPAEERQKFAKRTDAEVTAIYDQYLATGLYEAFLVSTLSRFESFLADVLAAFFLAHHCGSPRACRESLRAHKCLLPISSVQTTKTNSCA